MRYLALIAVYLALPLAAQTPTTPTTKPAPVESSGTKEIHDNTLTPEEQFSLLLAYYDAQETMLNRDAKLQAHQAGYEDNERVDQATLRANTLLAELKKKYAVKDSCGWHFAGKRWVCQEGK